MILRSTRANTNPVLSTVASKCGIACFDGDMTVTNSPEHIKSYIEGTIERLGFTPDLYYLHRIDPSECLVNSMLSAIIMLTRNLNADTPIESSIPALDSIRKAGKTKYIGLSECSAKTLRKANSSRSSHCLTSIILYTCH